MTEELGGYRLIEQLGSGGMGVVHLAVDAESSPVAVKVLHPHISSDETARRRLAREVRTLRRIHHPRIAEVLDAELDSDRPFIVTEFVDGTTLSADVRANGPFEEDELVHFGHALLDALSAVHRVGVIHRDLKPANVMIMDGEPMVIDFGIAQVADEVKVTATGLVMGTPGYLSPEIADGKTSSEKTDWWGWAATMVYAATGRNPYGTGPLEAVLGRVAMGRADLDGVPPRFAPLLRACLDPKPERRPSGAMILQALVDIESGRVPEVGGSTRAQIPQPQDVAGGAALGGAALGAAGHGASGLGGAGHGAPAGRLGGAPQPGASMGQPRPVHPGQGSHAGARQLAPEQAAAAVGSYPQYAQSAAAMGRDGTQVYGSPPQAGWQGAGPVPAAQGASLQRPPAQSLGSGPGQAPGGPSAQNHGGRPYGALTLGEHERANAPQHGPAAGQYEPAHSPQRADAPPRRGGTWMLVGLNALAIALTALGPFVILALAVVWQVVARSAGRLSLARMRRRTEYGPQGNSAWSSVARAPGALIASTFTTLFSSLLPLIAAAAAAVLVRLDVLGAVPVGRSTEWSIWAASGVFALVLWLGPGSSNLRRGSRALIRPAVRTARSEWIWTGILLTLAVFAAVTVLGGAAALWWPLAENPFNVLPQSVG